MLVFPELLLSTFVFASQVPGAPEKQAIHFQEVNLLDEYLLFTGWRGKVLGCVLELQLSLLAQVLRDETMSSEDFLQIRQPWPYQNTQLCFHHTSLNLSLSFLLSSIHRSNTVCSQWSELLGPAKGHSFCSALLSHFYCVRFPTPPTQVPRE